MAWLTIILYCSVFISSYGVSDDLPDLYTLAGNYGCDEFLKLIQDAGMEDVLKGSGPLTVFAPLDNGIHSLPPDVLARLTSDKKLLQTVLSYHVTSKLYNTTQYVNEMLIPSLQGENIRINAYPQQPHFIVTTSGSELIVKNAQARNGVLQVVLKVMYPLPNGTIVDLVTNNFRLSTLLLAINRANLAQTLSGSALTLLAPTNDAFSRLPPGTLINLLNDIPKLTDLLLYHVVDGTYYSAGLVNNTYVTAANKQKLTIKLTPNNGVYVNGVNVSTADVSVTNGVVHYIDNVLIPPSLFLNTKQ